MKKIVVIALLMSVCVLGAFAKKGKQPISFDKLPQPVQTEVQQFYKQDQIMFITAGKEFRHYEYTFMMADGTKLVFDQRAGLRKAKNEKF